MKFNEKLIELRRKEGLSQEELGYKLNVTRQTVSKWELGQTTPEMDKLVEIGKIFNISVDELVNDSKIHNLTDTIPITEQESKNKDTIKKGGREKSIKIILIVALIVVIVVLIMKSCDFLGNKWREMQEKNSEEKQKNTEQQDKIFDSIFNIFDNITNETDDEESDMEKEIKINTFNLFLESYSGTRKGERVKSLIDNIITSNKKESKKITVIYNENEIQDETEMKKLKQKFETFTDYEVSFVYDSDGYINKAIIENL